MVAERETDQAAKAALRSTMAAYDEGAKSYGLFGFDGDESQAHDIFTDIFTKHLEMGEGDYFQYADTRPELDEIDIQFDSSRMLSSGETIKYQILEDMKYVAPIEVGESIIDGFLQISSAMEDASTYASVASKIQSDIDDRESKLDEIEEKLLEAQEIMERLDNLINGDASSSFPEVNNLNDLNDHFSEYKDIRKEERDAEDDDDMDEDEREELDERIDDADDYVEEVQDLFSSITTRFSNVETLLDEVYTLLEEAEELNNDIKEVIDEERERSNENYSDSNQASDELSNNPIDSGGFDDAKDGIGEASAALDELVIDQAFFDDLKGKVASALTQVRHEELADLSLLSNMLSPSNISDAQVPWVNNGVTSTQSRFNNDGEGPKQKTDQAVEIILNDRPEMKEEEVNGETVEDKEDEADENLEDANDQLDDLLDEAESIIDDADLIAELRQLAEKYEMAIEDAEEAKLDRETTDELTEDAMGIVDGIFSGIGRVLLHARDEVYVNEYILTRFKHHDFSKSGTESYLLENNEVEYIMYGLSTPGANFAAAMTELFAFRFAVNFIEAFTQREVRAFGKFSWIAAIVYALDRTISDFQRLNDNRDILFFEGVNFYTSYKDYLRLFLFIHPEGNKMARLMAMIENDTNTDLTLAPTYVEVNATTSVDLWFLPGITDMLGRADILSGRVENKRYYIDKHVIYSY